MLKDTIIAKLDTIAERYEEVQGLLSQPEVVGDQEKFRTLSKCPGHSGNAGESG